MNKPAITIDRRPFSTGELFWARMCERASNTFVFYCRLRGKVNTDRLKTAVNEAAAVFPILGARVIQENDKYTLETGHPSRHKFRIIERQDQNHWHRLMNEELSRRIPMNAESLWGVAILSGPDYAELILSFNHLIGDGLSATIFLEEILSIYIGAKPSPRMPIRPSMEQLFKKERSSIRTLKNTFFHITDLFATARKKIYWIPEGSGSSEKFEGTTIFRSMAFTELESEAVTQTSKAHNTTVYGALCAALSLAIYAEAKVQGTLDIGISSSVNLRPELKEDVSRDFGFFATNLDIMAQVHAEADFWTLARTYSHSVKHQVETGKPQFGLELLRMVLKKYTNVDELRQLMVKQAKSTAMVTNMGRLRLRARFDDLLIEEIIGLPSSHLLPRSLLVMAALTFQNKLQLTFSYPIPFTNQEFAERLIEDVMKRLRHLPG